MPKRSAQEKIDRYQRKIRKLEQQTAKRKNRGRILSDSSSSAEENEGIIETAAIIECPPSSDEAIMEEVPGTEPSILMEETSLPVPVQSVDDVQVDPTISTTEAIGQGENIEVGEPSIDPDILSALGESTDDTPEFGDKIHEHLANLWPPLLKKGMPKENKEKILKEYLVPDNCRLLQAPKLNAEISAAVPEMVRNRDKNLLSHQQQLGSGITAVNRAMDLLLKGEDKIQAIKHLSNGCRILCDLHSISTQSRIKLVTPSLDKTFLHIIQDAERDETIFGSKLSEKIKAAKAIERQGLQIKKPQTSQKTANTSQSTGPRPNYSGNWSAPPRYPSNRGGRGGARKTTNNARRQFTAPQPPKGASQSKPRAPTS